MNPNKSSSKSQQQVHATTSRGSSFLNTTQLMSGELRPRDLEDDLARIHSDSPFNRRGFNLSFLSSPPTVIVPGSAEDVSSEVMSRYCLRRSYLSSLSKIHAAEDSPEEINNNSAQTHRSGVWDLPAKEILARLDEIKPEIVGAAYINKIIACAPEWGKKNLTILDDVEGREQLEICTEEEERERREKKGLPKSKKCRKSMEVVLDELVRIGMMEIIHNEKNEDINNENPVAHALMFMVEKLGSSVVVEEKNGEKVEKTKLRTITDAREANTKTKNNMTYNIFTLDALFQCVSNVHHHAKKQKQKEWYVINADLRHWFHQIRIPHHLRDLFRFVVGNKTYRMKVLPMGWYLSPAIAQTITWTMILDGQPPGIDKDQITEMPPWLELKGNSGGIFVLQDNILIATHSLDLAQQWSNHLTQAAEKFNVTFKDKNGPNVITIPEVSNNNNDDVPVEDESSLFTEFNGIDFFFGKWRTSKRHEREDLLTSNDVKLTHGQIASMMGETLWDFRVRTIQSLDREKLWSLFAVNVPSTPKGWIDINSKFLPNHVEILRGELEEVREHRFCECWGPWYPNPKTTKYYAVDASLERGQNEDRSRPVLATLGFVRFTEEIHAKSWNWKAMRSKHCYIGEAELEAIVWAVEDALAPREGRIPEVSMIIVATDSLCAKGWVERMYSDRPYARFLLRRLRELLLHGSLNPVRVVCVYLLSEHNLSDVPSRMAVEEGEIKAGNEKSGFENEDPDKVNERCIATIKVLKQTKQIAFSRAVMQGRMATKMDRLKTENRVKQDTQ